MNKTKKILILKNSKSESAGTLETFFKSKDFSLVTLELMEGDLFPDDPAEFALVIAMGGPMNVYEEAKYPFLKLEDAFIKKTIDKGVSFLGICLGAQLLSKAMGAKVVKAPQKEIGWFEVNITDEGKKDSVFKGAKPTLRVFQWHEDMFEIPNGGVLLADSKNGINQAFKFGKNAYGFQFHIEVTGEIISKWVNAEKGLKKKEEILKEYFESNAKYECLAESIYLNLLSLIKRN